MTPSLVKPMPDEPAIAHAGRVAFFNGLQDKRTFEHWLVRTAASAGVVEKAPRLRQLAAISGMDPSDYARLHSLLGVMRVAVKAESLVAHGAAEGDNFSRRLGMLTQKSHAHLCSKCVQEDLEHWKFSWYRRIHQVQGIDWCPSHQQPLLRVTAEDPWSKLPQHCLESGETAGGHRRDAFQESGFEARFIDIACELLERALPYQADALAKILKGRAREIGMRTSEVGVKENLSDRVQAIAPHEWLSGTWPHLTNKVKGVFHEGLDNVLVGPAAHVKGLAYLTAMAALWEMPLDMRQMLMKVENLQQSGAPLASLKRRTTKPASYWQGEFWRVYLKYQGRVRAMAPELEMDHTYLREKLNQLGLPSLHDVSTAARWRAFLRFQRGESILIACQEEGATVNEVEALVRLSCGRVAFAATHVLNSTPAEPNRFATHLAQNGEPQRQVEAVPVEELPCG